MAVTRLTCLQLDVTKGKEIEAAAALIQQSVGEEGKNSLPDLHIPHASVSVGEGNDSSCDEKFCQSEVMLMRRVTNHHPVTWCLCL